MADKVIRRKTAYKNIYYNESTEKYDVKFNYKEYDPDGQRNRYKAKWRYNCATVDEAKEALVRLQSGSKKAGDDDITLAGVLELWKDRAALQQFSEVTVRSTEQQMKAIYKYLPANTKLKDITEDVYYRLFVELKKVYSDETVHTLNSAFRKLINLAYRKGLISDNFLHRADNIKTKHKQEYTLLSDEDFAKIDAYFANGKSRHKGYNAYPRLRFLYNTLYCTGVRLSEVLALTWQDFEEFDYYSKNADKPIRLAGTRVAGAEHLSGMRVHVTKSAGRVKDRSGEPIVKEPKNGKHRIIPVPRSLERMYWKEFNRHRSRGGSHTDRIFRYSHSYVLARLKETCKLLGIDPACNCHTFRHTYISNLVKTNVPLPVIEMVSGDTQETIFKRYSHMFEQDEALVLKAMEER